VLIRLCRALDVEIDHLLRPDPLSEPAPAQAARRAVIRAGEGEPRDFGGLTGLAGATDLLRRTFTPVVFEVVNNQPVGGLLRASGEAYLMVLSGQIVMHSDAYAPLSLGQGDSVYFDGQMGFGLTTGGDGPARALLVHQGEDIAQY